MQPDRHSDVFCGRQAGRQAQEAHIIVGHVQQLRADTQQCEERTLVEQLRLPQLPCTSPGVFQLTSTKQYQQITNIHS